MATPVHTRALLRRAADPRVIGGVLIMAVSAYLGVLISQQGPEPVLVAVAARDLAAGVRLQPDDVALREVVIAEPGLYVGSNELTGSLQTPVAQGELIPRSSMAQEQSDRRLVAVPVEAARLPPDIGRGAQVDVWSTGDRPVLQQADVVTVSDPDQWAGATATVVLAVAQDEVSVLLAATRAGTVDVTAYQGGS